MQIRAGSTDQSVEIRIVGSDGLPNEAVNAAAAGLSLWYRREGGLKVAISPNDLATLTTAHADGGLLHIDDGYYRLDIPDAAVAADAGFVLIGGTVTGLVIIGTRVQITDSLSDLWNSRTLSQSVAAAYGSVNGSVITIKRGDDNQITLTGLGALGAWTKLYFTLKESLSDEDSEALVQILLSNPGDGDDGLIVLNGVSTDLTAADGAITVSDATDGDIVIRLKQAAAADLTPIKNGVWDVQVVRSSGVLVHTMTDGRAIVEGDATRATS